jgi:phosphoglycerol transferase MdoB-like AlkP superfamily enzyme
MDVAPIKTMLLMLCSALVGIGAMYLFHWLNADQPPANPYNFLWEKVFLSTLIMFGLVSGFMRAGAPWLWPFVMSYVHYFSGFVIMKFWGQFPPFELIYLGLLSLLGVATGYLGIWLRNRLWRSTGPVAKSDVA